MKELIKNLFLYCGLSRDSYINVQKRVSYENRIAISVFSLISAAPFAVTAIFSTIKTSEIPPVTHIVPTIAFLLIFVINMQFSKKYPRISDVFSILFVATLLAVGVYFGVTQYEHRTTLLLPFYILVSLIFSFRIIYLVVIMVSTEAVFLYLIAQCESGRLLDVNRVNTLIFCGVGLILGSYMMVMKYRKHEADYYNKYLLEHDTLTSLLNRSRCDSDFKDIEKNRTPCTVFEFDVNGLKHCNDTKGHEAGDELIVAAARCLESVFGQYGSVYRISGDEFVAILTKGEFNPDRLLEELNNMADNWHGELIDGFSLSGGYAKMTTDMGINIQEALQNADKAMYENKRKYYETREY